MTHSPSAYAILLSDNLRLLIIQILSDTGIGDFGPEGIASFVEDHLCDTICLGLGLNNQVPQVDDQQENGDAERTPEAEAADANLND